MSSSVISKSMLFVHIYIYLREKQKNERREGNGEIQKHAGTNGNSTLSSAEIKVGKKIF